MDAQTLWGLIEAGLILLHRRRIVPVLIPSSGKASVIPHVICVHWVVVDRALSSIVDLEEDGVEFFIEQDEFGQVLSASFLKVILESVGVVGAITVCSSDIHGLAKQVSQFLSRFGDVIDCIMCFTPGHLRDHPLITHINTEAAAYATYINGMTCPILEEGIENVRERNQII